MLSKLRLSVFFLGEKVQIISLGIPLVCTDKLLLNPCLTHTNVWISVSVYDTMVKIVCGVT